MSNYTISYDDKLTRKNILEVLELFPNIQFTLIQGVSTADLFVSKDEKRSNIRERIEQLCQNNTQG